MKKIAVIDDDIYIGDMVEEILKKEGYSVLRAYSGTEAVYLLKEHRPDLILLDLMLPGITGQELVPLFSPGTPVIVMSAKSSLDSKVELLSAGAEDYICKPFDLPELLVRIQVQLRRQARKEDIPAHPEGTIYHYREWDLNPDTLELKACGIPVTLTKHEFLILELMIRNPRRVFSKQMIYEYVWGEEYLAEDKTINVHISNIRAKLKASKTDSYIQTVWGMGFKLT